MKILFFRVLPIVTVAAMIGTLTGLSFMTFTNLPQVSDLEWYEPKSVTSLRDINGRLIHEFYRERRIPISLEKIPVRVWQTFLVAEDWRFYQHFGIDVRGLLRAFWKNMIEQRYAEGASTITQQLAKVLFLSPEKTLQRKLKEAVLAIQIERRYSKNEILGLYLNQIYLGSGCYGVEAAARTYFGKNIEQLTIAETAMLGALPKGPNLFSPFRAPQRAKERRDTLLKDMFERNVITKTEWLTGKEEPLPTKPWDEGLVPSYFASYVLNVLNDDIDEEQIYRGYLNIESTLNIDLQKQAEAAVQKGIELYAARHKIPLDQTNRLPQAALLAIDPTTGEIRAMVGGRSFAESQFNRATQALRQPGSSFKPVLYAAALEKGYTQASKFNDEKISFYSPTWGKWEPKNYENEYSGWIPMRVALERSKNMVAIRLLQAIGIPALQNMAFRLGFASKIAPNLSSALGSSSVTIAELARAYATFANGGVRPELHAIRALRTQSGVDLWTPAPPPVPVIDAKVAYILTDMLSGVIKVGTGSFANDLPCFAAGKTGTTDNNVDSLFAGFTSNLVAIAWVGFDDRKPLGDRETGAVAAGPIWKEFMASACDQTGTERTPPTGVTEVDVDHSSGKLPGRYCTDVIPEAFIEGSQPTEVCNKEQFVTPDPVQVPTPSPIPQSAPPVEIIE